MDCIRCFKPGVEIKECLVQQEVKGEMIEVSAPSFMCEHCGKIVMNGEQADHLMTLTANIYREKHGLLTGPQIKEFRQNLGMTQEEFADYLAVGVASIKRWELSHIQEIGYDKLIRLCCDLNFVEEHCLRVQKLTKKVLPCAVKQISQKEDKLVFD